MTTMQKVFKNLLPPGRAFRMPFGTTIYNWFSGMSDEPQRLKDYIDDVRDAGIPGRIPDAALADWEDDLAIRRNTSLTNKQRNDRIIGKLAATGGQSIGYMESVIQASGFPLYGYENNPVDNPDVRAYTSTLGGFTLGSGATLGAYTDRIDPRTVPGILIAGPDTYQIKKNYTATLGGFTLGSQNLGEYASAETIPDDYEIPPVPANYVFVWFLSGVMGMGDFVDIAADRWDDLKQTILEIKPAHTWVIVQVNLI